MSKTTSDNTPTTMEELLNSISKKQVTITQGQEVSGTVISVTPREVILDFGAKSEGSLPLRELGDKSKTIKVGDSLKAFVLQTETDSGQILLSIEKQIPVRNQGKSRFGDRNRIDWGRFITAKNKKSQLKGKVVEINKGGLILEVEGVRGFLPGSQIGINTLGALVDKEAEIVGQELAVEVIEIDQENNRLIFSQKVEAPEDLQKKLNSYKSGQKVSGKIISILPFGILVNIDGAFGIVFPSDVSWDRVEDFNSLFKIGQDVEAVVVGIESDLGRVNLSLKAAKEDPFATVAESFQADDVISGVIALVTPAGVALTLKNGVDGYMPASKMESGFKYEVGQKISCLVDSVDLPKRRINLAPFLTTTKDLIYK